MNLRLIALVGIVSVSPPDPERVLVMDAVVSNAYVNGSRVVCARVTTPKFLFITWTSIKRTAACQLLSPFESVVHDDGFELERKKHLVVELSIDR